MTNNGTAFAFSGPQTVTFTGSGTQNVSGASSTAFNTFAIGSNSVINLDNNDSALQFTIAGLSQNGGTWGSTASGAANPDDANFLGNGTLNVTPPTFGISFLQDAPAVTNAGAVFSPPVMVQLTSSATNLIINKMVTLTLNGGGFLNGITSQLTGTNGVATFTNLTINVAGTNYSLTATVTTPSLSVTGATFVVTTASASKLVYTSVPAITNTAGGTLSAFTVQIQDQFNNNVPSSGVPITMSLATGTFASGTTPINSDVNGTATFSDLIITNAGNNTLTASSPGLASANQSLVILPGTYAITFQQDAPSPATAGVTFAPPVAVRISDPFNNVLSNRTVTLSLLNGGTLNGTLSRTTANNGVATFTNLTINVVGTNYSLVATSTNSLSVTGITFAVNAAPASKLIYGTVPVTTNTAGQTLPAFVVQITDPFNNSIPTNGVPITMSLNTGTFASGTTPVNTSSNGSATFSDLVITNAGNDTLTASAAGLTSTNKALVILPAPYAITFQQNAPSVTNAGAIFTPAVAVRIADTFNNVLSNQTVTLSLLNGGTLNGTLSHATANNGVATFNNLSINVPGTNYALVASSTNSLSVTGNTFTVTTAAASKLVYTTPPAATNTACQTLPTFVVQVEDQFNNTIATNGVPITMSLSSGAFASGTTNTPTDSDGSSTFFDLVITNAGNNILTASAPGLTSTNKAITILNTAISSIAFIQDAPSATNDGAVFTPSVTVIVADTLNNGVSNATVTLSLNGGGTLNGTLTHATAGNGVATFNNLSINQTGNAYSLTASTTNSLSVTGHTFAITVGPIARYVVSAATPQTRGVPFGVTVTAQDVFSNTVPDSSTVVTMSGSSANVQFDGNGNSIFGENGDNMQVLSNGTFTISTEDTIAETITVTATDGTGKTGTSPSVVVNAASGDFRSATNGNWNAIATWQTWNGSAWVAASTTPAGGAGTNITIQSTHTVTDNVAVGLTGTLIAQGTASFSAGGSISVGSGGLVQNSGTINGSAATLIFQSGGAYQHNFTTVPGNIPISTWNAGSTVEFIGFTSGTISIVDGTGWNQVFQNVIWNCPNMSGSCNINPSGVTDSMTNILGNLTVITTGTGTLRFDSHSSTVVPLIIGGDFVLQSGTFDLGSDSGANQWILRGNYLQNGGTVQNSGSAGGTVTFAGANKTFTRNSGTLVGGNYNFIVTNNASLTMNSGITVAGVTVFNTGTLNCGTNVVSGTGSFVLNSGGALGIGSTGGIALSGATGNVQTTTRSFNTGGIYIYNGSVSQAAGSGLPATVSALIVTNTGGTVSLGATVSVTSNLTVSAGTFDLGSFTANRATSGGTLTVANGAALNIGGTNPFPSNYATLNLGTNSTVVYEGSAQNVSALPYGNLTTSGSGIKTLQPGATTIAEELTIGSGTTFAAGTNNFNIAGDWDNNGGFTSSGSQTVTFNGSSPQNVDEGTSLTTFNDVTINSNSVLNLAFTGSDNVQFLVIGGVTEPTGTWGATGSGAANTDNVHFQGTTGTLNVLASLTVPSSTALISSANPQTYGQPVTFTATVTGTGPVPTGTITFMDGTNTMGTGGLNAGQGLFVTNTLPAGLHLVTAIYGGDGNFNGSASGVLSQQITQAGLTVTGITANDKTYDGGTNATLNTGGAALVGVIGSDNVTLNTGGATGFFTDKNVGLGKTVNVSGLTIGGTASGNYSLTQPTTNASIFALSISVTAAANSKTYDGTNTAAASPTITTGSLQGTDIAGFSEIYDNKNVGTSKTLTPSGSVIDGNGGNNYTIAFFTANTGSISTRSITVTAAANTKTYDQTTSAAALPTITTGSLQGTDTAGFSETYSNKIVATGKTLTPAGSVNDGNSGNDYAVTFVPVNTGVINTLSLTVSATGVDKVYDGTTNATVTLTDNRLSGDSFSDTYTMASFADANVGSNKTVSVSGIAISGIDATNYTANTTASTTANITAGSLTISADNKSKTAGLSNPPLTASYVGFVGGDDTNSLTTQATLSTTATTNSPVGMYPITASGAASPNYTISYNSGTLTVFAVPQLTALGISGNQFIFSFPTLSNQLYQVEFKDDMSAPIWNDLGGPLNGTGGSITITNTISGSKRFFQVGVMPGQ